MSFKESNFGADMILAAAWKLRSVENKAQKHLSTSARCAQMVSLYLRVSNMST